jgi:hypothetical protein
LRKRTTSELPETADLKALSRPESKALSCPESKDFPEQASGYRHPCLSLLYPKKTFRRIPPRKDRKKLK